MIHGGAAPWPKRAAQVLESRPTLDDPKEPYTTGSKHRRPYQDFIFSYEIVARMMEIRRPVMAVSGILLWGPFGRLSDSFEHVADGGGQRIHRLSTARRCSGPRRPWITRGFLPSQVNSDAPGRLLRRGRPTGKCPIRRGHELRNSQISEIARCRLANPACYPISYVPLRSLRSS